MMSTVTAMVTAMAKAKVSRLQPCACVIGCSHSPKPWRIPIESVTMAAPQASTCHIESLGVEGICVTWGCNLPTLAKHLVECLHRG